MPSTTSRRRRPATPRPDYVADGGAAPGPSRRTRTAGRGGGRRPLGGRAAPAGLAGRPGRARPAHVLSVPERIRRAWPADLVAAASEQAELRTRGAAKFTRAASMLLTRAGLEQATGEQVAEHRARRFAGIGGTVLDLCCGFGGDLIAHAPVVYGLVVGVDRDETHA